MGSTTTTNGRVGEKRDDDQMKWDAGDGISTTTRNNHQINLTIKKSKWEREGERVGNPAPIAKITINQRWRTGRTQRAIMVRQASEVRGDGEDGKEGGRTTSQRSFPAIWREKKVPPLQTQHHNLSKNYIEMERRNDGSFLITRQISSALQAKIAQSLVTP